MEFKLGWGKENNPSRKHGQYSTLCVDIINKTISDNSSKKANIEESGLEQGNKRGGA